MNKKQGITKESQLFQPVKAYLENLGFEVYAEVKSCDITAKKEDNLLIVELKLKLNLELILQGIDRLDMTEHVYLAVPQERARSFPKEWRRMRKLLVRLGLGLLLVRNRPSGLSVEPVLEPGAPPPRRNKRRATGILKEMELRQVRSNTGGVSRTKLMTAYREQSLLTAKLLAAEGSASPKTLKKMGAPDKAGAIMYANHYGWFIHEEKGLYSLSPKGKEALSDYKDILIKIKP